SSSATGTGAGSPDNGSRPCAGFSSSAGESASLPLAGGAAASGASSDCRLGLPLVIPGAGLRDAGNPPLPTAPPRRPPPTPRLSVPNEYQREGVERIAGTDRVTIVPRTYFRDGRIPFSASPWSPSSGSVTTLIFLGAAYIAHASLRSRDTLKRSYMSSFSRTSRDVKGVIT